MSNAEGVDATRGTNMLTDVYHTSSSLFQCVLRCRRYTRDSIIRQGSHLILHHISSLFCSRSMFLYICLPKQLSSLVFFLLHSFVNVTIISFHLYTPLSQDICLLIWHHTGLIRYHFRINSRKRFTRTEYTLQLRWIPVQEHYDF